MVDTHAAIETLVDFFVRIVLLTQRLHDQAMGLRQVIPCILFFVLINRPLQHRSGNDRQKGAGHAVASTIHDGDIDSIRQAMNKVDVSTHQVAGSPMDLEGDVAGILFG